MAVALPLALARLRREPLLPDLPIANRVDQLCRQLGHRWRDRLLTPLVTIRLFILQVLHGNTSITHLRHLAGFDFSSGSYSEARQRLPLQLLRCLLREMTAWADCTAHASLPPLLGQRVLVGDGSSASMPDTPPLRRRFGLPPGQKAGIGYPMARVMGLLDAATGLFVELLALPLFTHDLRGMIDLHRCLRPGDILLGDRAFCSFAHFCLLNARGVFGCFRLHQRRKDLRPGTQRWRKPVERPKWISAAQYALLPAWIEVRLVHYSIAQRGYRTRHVWIATTLLDARCWSDEQIAHLYGQRWPIETCFNHLKTTLKMDVLKCQTVDGVLKELAVYLMVYNLVRLAMLKAAQRQQVAVARVSFIDAARCLAGCILGLPCLRKLLINPSRPGRHEPRVIRRRKKEYDLMTKPRAAYRQSSAPAGVGA
jgi:hypothetical protein